MNTVIEKLAEQAAEAVVAYEHDVVLRVEHEEGATLEVPADFIFELARLVAKECAEVCDRFQDRDVGMQPAECAGAIRQLFGIENGS